MVETEGTPDDVHLIADFLIDIAAVLENAQTKTGQDCQQVFHNVGLDFFEGNPAHFFGKTIDFERHTGIGGSQFPDEQRQIAADIRILLQIPFCIGAEGAEVGQILR